MRPGHLQVSAPLPPSPPVNKESPGANGPAAIEIYFGRSLGFALSTLAIMVILLTGSIPLTTSKAITTDESDPKAPYAVPTLIVSTVFQGFCAFYGPRNGTRRPVPA